MILQSAASPAIGTVDQAVQIGGTFRGASRVNLSRTIGGAGLLGHSGPMGAEGSVVAMSAQPGPEPSIWHRQLGNWPPRPGDDVIASIGTIEAGRWGVLQGNIRAVDRIAAHTWELDIADEMAPLRRTVSVPPLSALMPTGVGERIARPGLDADYYAHRVMRACGITNTPRFPRGAAGVSACLQGSTFPEVGELVGSSAASSTDAQPLFRGTPWGYGMHNGSARYRSSADLSMADTRVGLMVAPDHQGSTLVTLHNGPGTEISRVTVGSNRAVSVVWGLGADRVFLSLPAAPGWTRLTVVSGGGVLTVSTDDGRSTSTGTTSSHTFRFLNVSASAGSRVAGLMAGSDLGNYHGFTPNLRMTYPEVLQARLLTMSRIHEEQALDVLQGIAESALRACWRDEDGVVRWVPWCWLVAQHESTDVTSDEHGLDGWGESDTFDTRHRRVVVRSQWPETRVSRYPDHTVFTGSGVTLQDRESLHTDVVACPDNQTWIGPDLPATELGKEMPPDEAFRDFNRDRGSAIGGVVVGPGSRTRWAYPTATLYHALRLRIAHIGPDAWAFHATYQDLASLPNDYSVALRTPNEDTNTALWDWKRDNALPVVRVQLLADWVDREVSAGQGHPAAADYTHEGGRWVQGYTGDAPQVFADWLADHVLDPLGSVKLDVHPDPSRRVGAIVNFVDAHRHGITLRCLTVGIDQESWDEGGDADQTMTLSLVVLGVLEVVATHADAARVHRAAGRNTHGDVERHFAGATHGQVQQAIREGVVR